MGHEIVLLNSLIMKYNVPDDVQRVFEIDNGDVKVVDQTVFERVKQSSVDVQRARVLKELTVIHPEPKKRKLEANCVSETQAKLDRDEYEGIGSSGSTLVTYVGSILDSEPTIAGFNENSSHVSILQSEDRDESGVMGSEMIESELSQSWIIGSEPMAGGRSSPPVWR